MKGGKIQCGEGACSGGGEEHHNWGRGVGGALHGPPGSFGVMRAQFGSPFLGSFGVIMRAQFGSPFLGSFLVITN